MVTSRLDRAQLAARDNHERGVASRSGHALARALSVKLGHKADADSARCRSHWPSPRRRPIGRAPELRSTPSPAARARAAPLRTACALARRRSSPPGAAPAPAPAAVRAEVAPLPSVRPAITSSASDQQRTHPVALGSPRPTPPPATARALWRDATPLRERKGRQSDAARHRADAEPPIPPIHRSLRSIDPPRPRARAAAAAAARARTQKSIDGFPERPGRPRARHASPRAGWLVTMGGGEACARSMGVDVCACVPSLITLTCTSPGARTPRIEIT